MVDLRDVLWILINFCKTPETAARRSPEGEIIKPRYRLAFFPLLRSYPKKATSSLAPASETRTISGRRSSSSTTTIGAWCTASKLEMSDPASTSSQANHAPLKRRRNHAFNMLVYVERGYRAIKGLFLMRTVAIFSALCLGVSVAACGVMWGFGVFSGAGVRVTVGMMLGILLATSIGTALMALAVYSDQSGHDEAIFRVEKESDSAKDR